MNIIEQLAVFNKIIYFDDTHSYFINKDKLLSGTQLVNKVKPPFEKERLSKQTAKKLGKTQQEVLKMWEIEGKFSTIKGNFLHDYIENFYGNKIKNSNLEIIYNDPDINDKNLTYAFKTCVSHFHNFFKDTRKHLLPIRSELVIGDSEYNVAGMIDQLFYSYKTGKYHLFDWKTNKQIAYYNKYKQLMYPPISHMDKCEFNQYSLQLSIYRLILEKNTDLPIGDSFIVHFTEHNDNYKVHKCKDLRNECLQVINLLQNK